VPAHRVLQTAREALELPLDLIVLEGRDPPTRIADCVMVVPASRDDPFEAGAAFRELDSLHEAQLAQEVQSAVDAGDAGVPSVAAQALVDLMRGETAVLLRQEVYDRVAGAPGAMPGLLE
jgi:hypothetical protein